MPKVVIKTQSSTKLETNLKECQIDQKISAKCFRGYVIIIAIIIVFLSLFLLFQSIWLSVECMREWGKDE